MQYSKNLQIKKNLLEKNKWLRGIFVLLFIFAKYFVSWTICLIAIFQFGHDLLVGKPNKNLMDFTKQLNVYLFQIANFITYNTEIKPFPFSQWPSE